MKVMFCIQGLFNSGGMERVLINRVNYLTEKFGYNCIIITTDQNNKDIYFKLGKETIHEDLGINYLLNKGNILKRTKVYLEKKKKHKRKMEEIIKKYNPDIIVSMGDTDKYILPFVKGNIKIILEHHFEKYFIFKESRNFIYKLKDYIFIKKEEQLLDEYDEFLVLTEEDKKQYKSDKVRVINNPLSFYPKEISKLDSKKVISVGRLLPQKGYDLLIEIWRKVIKKYSDWTLEIYGEGDLRKELQEKINNYKLQNHIFLRGREKNIQMKYLESSIYVMSSRYEGMPMVLVEAQACGLPIISFNCPCGPKDIITNNVDGFLCEFGDIEDMANKIIYLIENKEKREIFGKRARENSLRFSEDKIMTQWKELLEKLIIKKEK